MSVGRSTEIQTTLDKMPGAAIRHLTVLQCAKIAMVERDKAFDDAWCGAQDAGTSILKQLGTEPVELCNGMQGVRLKKALFRPLRGVSLTPWQLAVYRAGLRMAEIQLRWLHDSNNA